MDEKERTGMPENGLREEQLEKVTGGTGGTEAEAVWLKRLLDSSLPNAEKSFLLTVIAKKGYRAARIRAKEMIAEYPEWLDVLR